MKRKMTALLVALFAMTLHLSAQVQERDYQLYPYMFGSLQGGVLKTYTGSGIDRDFKPMGAVSFGAFFTQVFGARAQFGASPWKMDIPGTGTDYKNKYYDIGVDLLFNLSNLVLPDRNNLVNVIAIAGVPFSMVVPHTYIDNYRGSITDHNRKWKMGWKGGGMIDFNISKNFSFNIEAGSNYIRPRQTNSYDKGRWWPYALAGVTFKFGHKKVKDDFIPPLLREEEPPVVQEPVRVVEQPKPQPKPEPKPEPKPLAPEDKGTHYRIQFCTASRLLKSGDPDLQGIRDIHYVKSGKYYIYSCGNYTTMAEARKRLDTITKTTGFKDAFIFGIKDGKRFKVD